jgi:hypothetical protein
MECNVKVFRYICPHYVAISRFVQVYARDINEETIIGLNEKEKTRKKCKSRHIYRHTRGNYSNNLSFISETLSSVWESTLHKEIMDKDIKTTENKKAY